MKNWILICILFLAIPAFAYGEAGERFEKNGYQLHISPTKLSSDLVVTCEIKNGEPAKKLHIKIVLFDETGRRVTVQHTEKNYKYPVHFNMRRKNISGGNRWKVSSIHISN